MRTPFRSTLTVSEARRPIVFSRLPARYPGDSVSTMNAPVADFPRSPSPVRAKTSIRSADAPFVTQRLAPLRIHPSASAVAVVASADGSLPACASDRAKPAIFAPDARSGSQRAFCASVPWARRMAGTGPFWIATVRASAASPRATSSSATR